MSKLADTLRKDGWELTHCRKVKPGDYVAVIRGCSGERDGVITDVVDNENGSISVFYGERGVEILPASTGALWVAPKEYEHLEVRWDTDGTKYINISADNRIPIFCLATQMTPKHIFASCNRDEILGSCKVPESLLKEKPE